MKTFTNLIAIGIVLAFMATIGVAGYYGFISAREQLVALEYPVREILMSTSIVFILGIAFLVLAQRSAANTIARAATNDGKHELYAHILVVFRSLMDDATSFDDRRRRIDELGQIYADLLILASGATTRAHMAMLTAIQQNADDRAQLEKCYQKLLRAFRRDMGHTDGYEFSNLKEILRFLPVGYEPPAGPPLEEQASR